MLLYLIFFEYFEDYLNFFIKIFSRMRSNNIGTDKKRQVKVLCSGDVNGNFKQLIARIALVNQKVLFCFRKLGEF